MRAAFETATLAAARRIAAQQPGRPLEALAVTRDARLLPARVERRRAVIFYINGRASNGIRQSSATGWVVPARMFAGEERITFSLDLPTLRHGSAILGAEFGIQADPLPLDARGSIVVRGTINYRFTMMGRRAINGSVPIDVPLVVDGDRVYVLPIRAGIPTGRFDGLGEYRQFELHLGFLRER
jgi:hypothetical protein